MTTPSSAGAPQEEGVAAASVVLDAPSAEVFRAFTDPRLLTQWLAVTATVEPRAGGRYDLVVAPDELEVSGIFVDFAPERGFLASWEAPGVEESLLELTIDPGADGRRVTLRHHGLPSALAAGAYTERWAAALARLAALFSGAT